MTPPKEFLAFQRAAERWIAACRRNGWNGGPEAVTWAFTEAERKAMAALAAAREALGVRQ